MIACLFGLLVPAGLAYAALSLLLDAHARGTAHRLLCAALAMGLSVGLTSCLWFAWLCIYGTPGLGYFAVEALVFLGFVAFARWSAALASQIRNPPYNSPPLQGGAGGVALHNRRPAWQAAKAQTSNIEHPTSNVERSTSNIQRPPQAIIRNPQSAIRNSLLLLSAVWLASFASTTAMHPYGRWDSVAIWNLHARVLASPDADWSEFFRQGQRCASHADYPLLLPVTIARLWSLAGEHTPLACVIVALWFSTATVLLCGAAVAVLRGNTQGLLAALVLLATSYFVRVGSSQFADAPLALFILAALVLFLLHFETGRPLSHWLLLAGMATGLAAWTKNEGQLFVLVSLVAFVPCILLPPLARGGRGGRQALRISDCELRIEEEENVEHRKSNVQRPTSNIQRSTSPANKNPQSEIRNPPHLSPPLQGGAGGVALSHQRLPSEVAKPPAFGDEQLDLRNKRGIPQYAYPLLVVFAGLAPALLCLAWFKLNYAPANDLVAGQGLHATLSRLFDVSRYLEVAMALGAALLKLSKGLVFALPAYALLLGQTRTPCSRQARRFALAVLLLMLAGYFFVYVTTPNDLTWHLSSSAVRLLCHLWPAVVALFFFCVATPEERMIPAPRVESRTVHQFGSLAPVHRVVDLSRSSR